MEPDKGKKRMTVSKDVNLGTLVPIMAILLPMSLTAIWWAGSTTSRFESVVSQLSSQDTAISERISRETLDRIDDRRRIYDRLVGVEQSVAQITTEAAARAVAMRNLEVQLTDLRTDLRQNNELLRNLLIEIGSARQRGLLPTNNENTGTGRN